MHIRFHTTAAIVVLVISGLWVATGKYSFVGSDIAGGGQSVAAETPDTPPPAKPDTAPAESGAPQAAKVLQSVEFIVANPADYARHIRLSGQTEADKEVTLVARTSGVIAKLPLKDGDHVEEGGLVMALDGPEKRAAVLSAQAQFDTAAHQAETSQKLNARGTLPEMEYESIVAAREVARSALEAARAEVDRLEVHAPFAGTVDKVLVETGSWVQPGTEVASLLALDPIIVVGEINERDVQAVTKGTKAAVTFGDGTSAEGAVRSIRQQASGVTRTFPIEVAIANPDGKIPSGMSAEIDLSAKTSPAVSLPRSVVTLDPDGNLGVRVLTKDDTVAFQKVSIVDDTPDGMVLSGIPPQARIIVSGQNMVTDGQQVTAVAAPAGAPAAKGSN